jgi:hypothetical protein
MFASINSHDSGGGLVLSDVGHGVRSITVRRGATENPTEIRPRSSETRPMEMLVVPGGLLASGINVSNVLLYRRRKDRDGCVGRG